MADPPPSQKGYLLEVFAHAQPIISAIAQEFLLAGNTTEHEKIAQQAFDQRQDEIKLSDDLLTREQISRPINNSRLAQASKTEQKRKAKSSNDFMFRVLLDQMRERITELEEQMAKRYETLRGKYGDDVIGGMASAFLSEEKLAELETDEHKMWALAREFLDENGEIKDQFKNLEEAKYIRDWVEVQKLKPVVAKYDGRDNLTADEQREVQEAADKASLADNKNKISLSGNDAYKDTVDQEINTDRRDQGKFDISGSYNFR